MHATTLSGTPRPATGADGRSNLATSIAIVSQLGLGASLAWLAVSGQWLSSVTGIVSIVGGAIALALAGAWWLRTGHRPALIVVDLWFVAFGSLLVDGGGNPVGMDDGLSVWTHAAYAALLGGAMPVIGIGWGALGVVGALAVWRSRRRA